MAVQYAKAFQSNISSKPLHRERALTARTEITVKKQKGEEVENKQTKTEQGIHLSPEEAESSELEHSTVLH